MCWTTVIHSHMDTAKAPEIVLSPDWDLPYLTFIWVVQLENVGMFWVVRQHCHPASDGCLFTGRWLVLEFSVPFKSTSAHDTATRTDLHALRDLSVLPMKQSHGHLRVSSRWVAGLWLRNRWGWSRTGRSSSASRRIAMGMGRKRGKNRITVTANIRHGHNVWESTWDILLGLYRGGSTGFISLKHTTCKCLSWSGWQGACSLSQKVVRSQPITEH